MAELTCELLGVSKEQLLDMVVARCADQLMCAPAIDEDGDECALVKKLRDEITKRLDASIALLADEHITPGVNKYLSELMLKKTNRYGEVKGEPVSLVEYIVHRAELYMREEVDYDGKTRKENSYSSFRPAGTRISYAVDKYLQYTIENAMKSILQNANSILVEGIKDAVGIKLDEIRNKLTIKVVESR